MWYAIAGLFFGILLLRAALFRPKKAPVTNPKSISFDQEQAIAALQKLVQCKTVSHVDKALEDESEFQRFYDLLPQLYPEVFRVCQLQRFPDRGLLFRWPGKAKDAPRVMMAHYDVVTADETQWDKPAFSGMIEDGVMWGRGTLDTKVTVNGILFAANHLIGQDFVPEQDIYFAFSGGEEINGSGAAHIVAYFQKEGIVPALVLDEGGAVVEKVFPGVNVPCGLIGIAEKGMMNVCYSVRSQGGHASAPPPETPITQLAKACRRVIAHPFPMGLTKPALEMFDTLARHSNFGMKLIFANLWLFRPVLDLICRFSGGELNALVRTTTAFTMAQGSDGRNVIPTQASLVSNMRLNPRDSVASAKAYLEKVVKDPTVEIRILESFEPSPISRTDCDSWDMVAHALSETWPGCVVAPYLMVQCADARHYGPICDRVYRFSAMDLTAQERKTIHGNNERIRLESIERAVSFYIRLMEQC